MADQPEKTITKLITFAYSTTGREPFIPMNPAEVPAWVKRPDRVRRMLDGEAICKPDEPHPGSAKPLWYIAVESGPAPTIQ